jgi:hypothetical protein
MKTLPILLFLAMTILLPVGCAEDLISEPDDDDETDDDSTSCDEGCHSYGECYEVGTGFGCNRCILPGIWGEDSSMCYHGFRCYPLFCLDGNCERSDYPIDCDDSFFCNGEEYCSDSLERCVSLGNPCPDDGLWCNGEESCDEDSNECAHSLTPEERCPDNGVFCDGQELCFEDIDDCVHTGDPCDPLTEICNEDTDTCDPLNASAGVCE